jgi:hypothetical protein
MSGPARSLSAAALLALLVISLTAATPGPQARQAKPPAARRAAGAHSATGTPAAEPGPRDSAAFDSTASDSFAPPQLYLSWRAPYGMPGATDTISFGTGDSNRVDTLYMSFETGRSGPEFLGVFARLYLHPAFGDTLGTYWHYGYGAWNYRNVAIEFDPDGSFPCPQPWIHNGMGFPDFDFNASGAKLDLYYVITRLQDAIPVDGHVRYCFARVMFRQKQWHLPGATQPVCLEWALGRFSVGRRDVVARRGAQRCVSINSPDGSVCLPYRRDSAPPNWVPNPWRPPTPGR